MWIEGNDSVIQLLEGLGLPRAEYTMNNKLEDEICYQTGTGKIIIIPYENPELRPRIKAVSFTKKDKSEGLIIDY